MKELRRYDGECRSLFKKKLLLKSGENTTLDSEVNKEDRNVVEVQKKKVNKRIAENKVRHIKTKILAQKKTNSDLDKELDEAKKTIKDKLDQNEQISKRAKELKSMIVVRKNSVSHNQSLHQSQVKTPPSPNKYENQKVEL
jgi:hypothetical protein